MDANPYLPGRRSPSEAPDLTTFRSTADPDGPGRTGGFSPPPGDAPPREPSLLTRFFALFSSPSKAFAAPRGRAFWLVPMIITALVQGAHTTLLTDLYSQEQRKAIAQSSQFSEEQRARILEQLESQDESGLKIVQTATGMVIGALFTLVVPAALLMFGINFGVGGAARFTDALGVLSLTSLLYLVREAITIPLKLSQQTLDIYTGPAAFLDKSMGIVHHIAVMFDLFDLYRLFLVIVGLAIVGKVSTGRSATVVLAFWGLLLLVQIGMRLSPLGAFMP